MKSVPLLAILLVIGSTALGQTDGNRVFRAGAAMSNITPPLGSLIVGGWTPTPAKNVHDELHARCLVLDDGQTRLAIVVADSVGIPRPVLDEAKRMIHEKSGLPRENMLVSASHTHSAASSREGISLGKTGPLDEYQRFVATRIADGVSRAIENMQPARVGWGSGHDDTQVFNRRWRMKPGTVLRNPFGGIDEVIMNPSPGDPNLLEPAGPVDPEISFLSVQALSGRPIALLANYSLHYVGGVPPNDISADYFAVFARRIEQMLGARDQDPPFVGIMSNGTSANINNIDFPRRHPVRKWQPYEKMRAVANILAAEVLKSIQTVEYRNWVPLGAAVTEIPVAVRVPSKADLEWAEGVLKRPKDAPKLHQREEVYARRTVTMKDYPSEIPLILQALRIGDVGIGAIPNEVFVEIGLEVKKRSPLPRTFVISLANGSYGYLPTAEQHKLGGYETWRGTNILEIEAAPKIVASILGLLENVKNR